MCTAFCTAAAVVSIILGVFKKDSIVDTISAMEFCFICEKQLIFALLPLILVVLRAFYTINPQPLPRKDRSGGFCTFEGSIVHRINIEKDVEVWYNYVINCGSGVTIDFDKWLQDAPCHFLEELKAIQPVEFASAVL